MIVKRKEMQNIASRNVKKQDFYPAKSYRSNPFFSLKNRLNKMEFSFKMADPPYHSFWNYELYGWNPRWD